MLGLLQKWGVLQKCSALQKRHASCYFAGYSPFLPHFFRKVQQFSKLLPIAYCFKNAAGKFLRVHGALTRGAETKVSGRVFCAKMCQIRSFNRFVLLRQKMSNSTIKDNINRSFCSNHLFFTSETQKIFSVRTGRARPVLARNLQLITIEFYWSSWPTEASDSIMQLN